MIHYAVLSDFLVLLPPTDPGTNNAHSTDFTTAAATTAATSKYYAVTCYFIQLLLLAVRLLIIVIIIIILTLVKPEQRQMTLQLNFLSFRNFFSPSTAGPIFYVHTQYCSAVHSLFFKLFMYNFTVKNSFSLHVFP